MIILKYSADEILKIAGDIKNSYKCFKTITCRQDNNDLYFIAHDFNEVKEYLRYKKDGNLFVKLNEKWSLIQGFPQSQHTHMKKAN